MFCRISEDRLNPDSFGARLRRLPAFEPPAGGWETLTRRMDATRRYATVAGSGLALAASLMLGITLWPQAQVTQPAAPTPSVFATRAEPADVAQLIETSQQLEQSLARSRPEVWDAEQAQQARALQRSVTFVDQQLNYAQPAASSRLWRERVELMNALVELREDRQPALQYAAYHY